MIAYDEFEECGPDWFPPHHACETTLRWAADRMRDAGRPAVAADLDMLAEIAELGSKAERLEREHARQRDRSALSWAAQERGLTDDDIAPGMPGRLVSGGNDRPVHVINVKRRIGGRVVLITVETEDRSVEVVECTRRKNGQVREKHAWARLILGEYPTPNDDSTGFDGDPFSQTGVGDP